MMSWCRVSCLIRHFKGLPDVSRVASVACGDSVTAAAGLSRMLHTSPCLWKKKLPKKKTPLMTKKKDGPRVTVYSDMTVQELAQSLDKNLGHVFDVLGLIPNTNGIINKNSVVDTKTIIQVVKKSGMIPEMGSRKKDDDIINKDVIRQPPPQAQDLTKRPPVVTIMGHVDHGKTTLLDCLRNSSIVDKEFGGITQHIGAFLVRLESGESICFLDTPGHAAFSAMRSRGAHLTDIVVLVVSADDGVMQQTLESIQHARDSDVPIIVAINKIDKANANVEGTKYALMEHDVLLEEYGGDTQAVEMSALTGRGVRELQDAIVALAELMDLQGDATGKVEGRVVEARHDGHRGRMVTAVVQRGTLKKGDHLVAGTTYCKVRGLYDEHNQTLTQAGPAQPVDVWGFKETPNAGDEILQVSTESEAKSVIDWRKSELMRIKQEEDDLVISEKRREHHDAYHAQLIAHREQGLYKPPRVPGARQKQEVDHDVSPHLSLVLKADVDGSMEAILDTLATYTDRKCQLNVISAGVGSPTDRDIETAAAFGGEVFAFNLPVPVRVAERAKEQGVPIRQHNIIYRLFEDLKDGLNSKLPKLYEDVVLGEAKVLQVFEVTLPNKKKTYVAGCRCTDGNVSKKLGIKVYRDEEIIYTGKIITLKNFKVEVESVKSGQECGISLDDPNIRFEPQDRLVSYEVTEVEDHVNWTLGF